MTKVANNLGGDCPQERLDKIKAAWMARYDRTEEDWINFSAVTQPSNSTTINYVASGMGYTSQADAPSIEFDSFAEEQSKMEFLLCPDWDTMQNRYKDKERYCRSEYFRSRYTDAPIAQRYLEDAEVWKRMAALCSIRNDEIRRNR